MCEAYHIAMTQAEGYVWFLPGWYQDDWYNIDMLKVKGKEKGEDVKDLQNCSTADMEKALEGHMTLSHQNYADDDYVIDSG